ncbi:hypothetical protein V8B97DRAFT_1998772 [Scleroderma yunnanense]
MPPEKQSIICESCGKTFKPTGIGPHWKSCLSRARKRNEDLAFAENLCTGSSNSQQVNLNDNGSNVVNSGDRCPAPAPDPVDTWALNDLGSSMNIDDVDPQAYSASDPDIHNINDIWAEYHLNSGKPMNTQRFLKFTWGHVPKAYKPDLSTDPWHPF